MEADKPDKYWLFKPGQSGNPGGRTPLTDEEKQAKHILKSAIAHLGTKTMDELKEIAGDPKSPVAHALEAKALQWFFEKGNPGIYKEIHERILGKVSQPLDVEVTNPYLGLPKERLLELAEQEIDRLKKEDE